MKYAFMTFSTPELALDEVIAVARKYGYDGIEPRTDSKHKHGIEVAASKAERDQIKAAAGRAGVALACLATSCRFAGPQYHDAQVAAAHERIDLAGDLGIPTLRVFGGEFPLLVSRAQAADLLAAGLAALAGHAAERGVILCVETHDAWCNARDLAGVLARVNHPAVACNWDIMHPVFRGGNTMDEAFAALKPWIRHLHVHDGRKDVKDTLVPIGQGIVDHGRALQLLKTIAYAGFISGEWINWEPFDTHLPRELAALRALEKQ